VQEVTCSAFCNIIIGSHSLRGTVWTSSTYLTLLFSGQSLSISAVLPYGMTGKDKNRACCSLESR